PTPPVRNALPPNCADPSTLFIHPCKTILPINYLTSKDVGNVKGIRRGDENLKFYRILSTVVA
ncbi:MAG: hypothetical protein ACP5I8_13090, partial [Phycisphaerae bacterium]